MAAEDPYYTRKQIPTELIADVGYTGLAPAEEYENRERKYSATGADVRRFSRSKTGGLSPQTDPYYSRKRVPDALISGVGETGLSPEEEYLNRERKYSATGVDVRRFSNSSTGFLNPTKDPYYGRKSVHKSQIVGIGETNMSPAQEYDVRERKESLFQTSGDPFANVANRPRGSVSGLATSAAHEAFERRRSSAVAPNMTAAAAHHQTQGGYGNQDRLHSSQNKPELPPVNVGDKNVTTTTTTTTTTGYHMGSNTNGTFHDKVTNYNDPDSVAPDESR